MHTIEEAKELWCPHARLICGNGTVSGNRHSDGLPLNTVNCIADKCMMWKWLLGAENRLRGEDGKPIPAGYCGLTRDKQ